MPVLNHSDLETATLATGHYGYSGTRLGDLGAAEYTLVSIVADASGSVAPFRAEMEGALQQIVHACRYSPRADNLLLRLTAFADTLREVHGFKLLENCHPDDYDGCLRPCGGSTALYDAAENVVSATVAYGQRLAAGHFAANGIVFVLTDGADNVSTLPARAVGEAIARAVQEEALESLTTILIGVNVGNTEVARYLATFRQEAGFSEYVEMADADGATLARLADFIARSIRAQSVALGTGAPSRSLTF